MVQTVSNDSSSSRQKAGLDLEDISAKEYHAEENTSMGEADDFFWGRSEELRVVEDAFDRNQRGDKCVLFVEGDCGGMYHCRWRRNSLEQKNSGQISIGEGAGPPSPSRLVDCCQLRCVAKARTVCGPNPGVE